MSANEVLRRMLDERGVEWTEGIARPELTQVRIDGKVVKFHPWQPNTLKVSLFDLTPEQAIAATLGSCNCSNSERTNETCLPHFWTHDGTLHVESTRMPTRIVVCEGGTCEFVPKRELYASEAENAKLREELEVVGTAAYLYGRDDLKAENAKLRELAAKMARALGVNSEWCDRDCEREFGCGCEPCPLDQALRELGVEVDG